MSVIATQARRGARPRRWLAAHGLLALSALQAVAAPAPDLDGLLAAKLEIVSRWRDIPAAVRQTVSRDWRNAAIADPGQPFQSTDVIAPGPPLPGRRLVLAARSDANWIVCWESGGIAHSFALAVVPLDGERVRSAAAWEASLLGPVTDLDSLRALVRQGRYRGSPRD